MLKTLRHEQDNVHYGCWLFTPALSHDQVLEKGLSKRSMNSEPFGPSDTRKYCQNLKTWGKTDFLPKKWVKKTLKWA